MSILSIIYSKFPSPHGSLIYSYIILIFWSKFIYRPICSYIYSSPDTKSMKHTDICCNRTKKMILLKEEENVSGVEKEERVTILACTISTRKKSVSDGDRQIIDQSLIQEFELKWMAFILHKPKESLDERGTFLGGSFETIYSESQSLSLELIIFHKVLIFFKNS